MWKIHQKSGNFFSANNSALTNTGFRQNNVDG